MWNVIHITETDVGVPTRTILSHSIDGESSVNVWQRMGSDPSDLVKSEMCPSMLLGVFAESTNLKRHRRKLIVGIV